MILTERELEFDFPDGRQVQRLDQQGKRLPIGMRLVDFVIEEDTRVLLLEITDPSHPNVPAQERTKFIRSLHGDNLINEELVPKARDSYTYLHLMERDDKPFVFVALMGLEAVPVDPILLPNFNDRLLARLRQETDEPWRREYVTDCVVVTIETWNSGFPQYPLRRIK